MNLETIRSKIENIKGQDHNFRFNGNRNQIEEFQGVIIKTYPAIFVIHSNENKIRSFSYNDIITSSLEIIDIENENGC